MSPIEEYLENADALSQNVVNAWCETVRAGDGPLLTDEFKSLFDEACRFRTARMIAENHQQHGVLTEPVAAEVEATRRAFAGAYKIYWEEKRAAA